MLGLFNFAMKWPHWSCNVVSVHFRRQWFWIVEVCFSFSVSYCWLFIFVDHVSPKVLSIFSLPSFGIYKVRWRLRYRSECLHSWPFLSFFRATRLLLQVFSKYWILTHQTYVYRLTLNSWLFMFQFFRVCLELLLFCLNVDLTSLLCSISWGVCTFYVKKFLSGLGVCVCLCNDCGNVLLLFYPIMCH